MPTCARCGRSGETLSVRQGVDGEARCRDCRKKLMAENQSREAGQATLQGAVEDG